MASEFGRGVLAESGGPGSESLLPPLPEMPRPHRPHQVPRRTRPVNPYSSFGFGVVKVLIVGAVLVGVFLGVAALNRLPAGLQDQVADAMEGFGLHLPHHDEPAIAEPTIPAGTGPGVSTPPFPPVSVFDPDELTVPTVVIPEIEVPPPAIPTAP